MNCNFCSQRLSSSKTRIKTRNSLARIGQANDPQRLSSSKTRIKTSCRLYGLAIQFALTQRLSSSKTRIKTPHIDRPNVASQLDSETKFQ